ncbi:DUF72 domain-containing protein [Kurthia sibirica]|uniref:DUF72 domain-containing protein n=1 Tax=Kurthia sibirica TaxID=202750 RepID=A0A2U3AIR4_9BACL|nr:DUF72 domain-containing protein [Kurthia sibirica]PWI24420.1 DUF72 domain-containing protein [Kurthia sibirica]GEK33838.1 UPF0759 protein YunF [Kurthia sibirica]
MIQIGLTGWGDHPAAYSKTTKSSDKLFDYSGHFPIVELDTSFYAIPSEANIKKWIKNTPDGFTFVMKAYQGMTGHLRENLPYTTKTEMFDAFKVAADIFYDQKRLAMILVQFPPWFDCQYKNVQYIRYVKEQLEKYPIAIEFRNRTWFNEQFKAGTLGLLKELNITNTVCDEPQIGEGSIPLVAEVTTKSALVRIHGRNVHGWRNPGNAEQWRKVRFLYNYNDEELLELKEVVEMLQKSADHVYVLFNNNSDYDAFPNAKELKRMLAIKFEGLSPKQLDLFGGGEF